MKNPKSIFAVILAIVFCFAGYNLWGYFQDQQSNKQLKDREAHSRLMAAEDRKLASIAAEKEREEREAAARAEKERLAAIEREKRTEAQKLAQAEADAKRAKLKAQSDLRKQAEIDKRIQTARTPRTIEGILTEAIDQTRSVSARYIRENPQELLAQKFDDNTFNNRRYAKLMTKNTNSLMFFSALSPNTDHIQALLDIGMDINTANDKGYTPLMFASAYNTPEAVKFLIDNGANKLAKSYVLDTNALHIAALFNPNPDVVEMLVSQGFDIEQKTEGETTASLIAAEYNRNLEVVERLAKLGADKEAYDRDGKTALSFVRNRIAGVGQEYYRISDDVDVRVINGIQ